ncbi:MAG: tRNA dihydrouridine synthase DusB [Desulfobacterales bacterium]
MNIGNIPLENNTILAPLAGITNLPFRLLAKEAGCGLVCSEMISANGLIHRSRKTVQLMDSISREKPLSVQIFGSKPEVMAEAAKIIEMAGADILDINFGCSVKKIVKTGAGVSLMRNPDVAESVITAVRKAVRIPVTIKIRSGWDRSGEQALEIAKIAETCGADAISIHPRTATQGFGGSADWELIKKVKMQASIPVIGNGDIVCAGDAIRMLETTGCDGVMVGRAAIGNPLIFSLILARIKGEPDPLIDFSQRIEMMKRYIDDSIQYIGELHACRIMRSRLGWFVKGFPHAATFRESIKRISTRKEALDLIELYENQLQKREVL